MTARELIALLGAHPALTAGALALAPALAAVMLLCGARRRQPPFSYVDAFTVYAACVPGVGALMLSAYVLFFSGESLLDLSLTVSVLPVAAMALALALLARGTRFDDIPGFKRLSGLILLIALSFAVVLALSRTRLWLVFGGSIASLLLLVVAVFFALRAAATAALGHGRSSKRSDRSVPLP